MAERENKKKLTKEELHEENEKIRVEMRAKNATSKQDQQRLVRSLSKKNMLTYALVLFLPPVGIYMIWKKKEELYMNTPSLYLWTFVGVMVIFAWIQQIVRYFA